MFFILLLFLATCLESCVLFAWAPMTHEDITEYALADILDKKLVDEISDNSDEPDCCHPAPWYIDISRHFTIKCLTDVDMHPDRDLLCSYDHGISQFMSSDEKQRFPKGGAEKAVVCFVQKAREAKARNDEKWITYFS